MRHPRRTLNPRATPPAAGAADRRARGTAVGKRHPNLAGGAGRCRGEHEAAGSAWIVALRIGSFLSGQRALGKVEASRRVECDVSDGGVGGGPSVEDFHARGVAGEAAVEIETHRPDLRAFGDGVVEPLRMDGEPLHQTLARRKAPCSRIVRIELRVGDVAARRRIVPDRSKLRQRPRLDAVIEIAEIDAVEIETVDAAALQVRDVEHAAARIEGEAAEAWPAIVDAVGLNGRE